MALSRKAVFLDKDGTLVRDVPFNDDPARVELLPGVTDGLRALAMAGFRLIVVTNQSGLARGVMSERGLRACTSRLEQLLADEGVALDGFYVCPHHPDGTVPHLAVSCECRKPMPGLVVRAASEHGIDASESWLVGDILDDVEAGNRAGCRTVLLRGSETEWLPGPHRTPEIVADGLHAASAAILEADDASPSRRWAL